MADFPDAPWVTDYDKYFDLYSQCTDEEEVEEDEERDS